MKDRAGGEGTNLKPDRLRLGRSPITTTGFRIAGYNRLWEQALLPSARTAWTFADS